MRALLLAVRDQARKTVALGGLGFDDQKCDVTPGGKPHPRAGKFFMGIHRGGTQGVQVIPHERDYSIKITVSLRIEQPFDRVGHALLEDATTGLDDRADAIIAMMENYQYVIMNAANTYIGASYNGFVEPLRFTGSEETQIVGGDWFEAEQAAQAGAINVLNFGRAKRIQLVEQVG